MSAADARPCAASELGHGYPSNARLNARSAAFVASKWFTTGGAMKRPARHLASRST
ncbi:MAG: hypothetical protein WCO88_10105 [Actinomycetota bacterium]